MPTNNCLSASFILALLHRCKITQLFPKSHGARDRRNGRSQDNCRFACCLLNRLALCCTELTSARSHDSSHLVPHHRPGWLFQPGFLVCECVRAGLPSTKTSTPLSPLNSSLAIARGCTWHRASGRHFCGSLVSI